MTYSLHPSPLIKSCWHRPSYVIINKRTNEFLFCRITRVWKYSYALLSRFTHKPERLAFRYIIDLEPNHMWGLMTIVGVSTCIILIAVFCVSVCILCLSGCVYVCVSVCLCLYFPTSREQEVLAPQFLNNVEKFSRRIEPNCFRVGTTRGSREKAFRTFSLVTRETTPFTLRRWNT